MKQGCLTNEPNTVLKYAIRRDIEILLHQLLSANGCSPLLVSDDRFACPRKPPTGARAAPSSLRKKTACWGAALLTILAQNLKPAEDAA
jgi:hypothetical protein